LWVNACRSSSVNAIISSDITTYNAFYFQLQRTILDWLVSYKTSKTTSRSQRHAACIHSANKLEKLYQQSSYNLAAYCAESRRQAACSFPKKATVTLWRRWCSSSNVRPKFIQHHHTSLLEFICFPNIDLETLKKQSNWKIKYKLDYGEHQLHHAAQTMPIIQKSSKNHPTSLDNLATLQYCEFVFSTNLEIKKNPIKDQV
jgi:hypothetical protein